MMNLIPKLSVLRYAVVGLLGIVASGCGGGTNDAPERFPISGKVSYDGKPVPKGNITFIPDSTKGNSGPSTTVAIVEGMYQSKEGTIGGPHIAQIAGYDGIPIPSGEGGENPTGKELFNGWKKNLDLPKESTTEDFEVPKSQGRT